MLDVRLGSVSVGGPDGIGLRNHDEGCHGGANAKTAEVSHLKRRGQTRLVRRLHERPHHSGIVLQSKEAKTTRVSHPLKSELVLRL